MEKNRIDFKARAELIKRENSDPEIRARKEEKILAILEKWEQMGLIKFTDNNT